jgi:hypothetical protein
VTRPPVQANPLDASLERVRRGVLLTLATCALVIVATGAAEGDPPARIYPVAAVGLALAAIFTRQAAAAAKEPRSRLRLSLASLLLAGSVGLVGVALSVAGGPRTTALAYALGAAILCLRPPAGLVRR